MGLDIHIRFDNDEDLFRTKSNKKHEDYFNKNTLSRTFCNMIAGRHVVEGFPELEQIFDLCDMDILPLYEMEGYTEDHQLEEELSFASSVSEKEKIKRRVKAANKSIEGNLDSILQLMDHLIKKVEPIDDLTKHIEPSGHRGINFKEYFSDFKKNKGDGYIDNNFGQDLRNFKKYLEFAKKNKSKTVFFVYG